MTRCVRPASFALSLLSISLFAAAAAAGQGRDPAAPGAALLDGIERGAATSARVRRAALAFLEDARLADGQSFAALFAAAATAEERARVILSAGRVGAPEHLGAFFARAADAARTPGEWDALAVAAGIAGDVAALSRAAREADPATVAIAWSVVRPAVDLENLPVVRAALAVAPLVRTSRGLADRSSATLTGAAGGDNWWLSDWARRSLCFDAGADSQRGAIYYFARSKSKAPEAALDVLRGRLADPDPEVAAWAARALARGHGAGQLDAAAIAAAYAAGGDRVTQIDRLRALAALPAAPGMRAVTSALQSGDPHLRRTALETLTAQAARMPSPARAAALTRIEEVLDSDPVADVRRAAVLALAGLDPDAFERKLPALRLADPWMVRAAAAEACARELKWWPAAERFLADPDRRVRSAALEVLAEPPAHDAGTSDDDALATERRKLALLNDHLVSLPAAGPDADGRAPARLLTADPVEVSLIAKLLTGLRPKVRAELRGLEPQVLCDLLAPTEVECLQSVIDYAAVTPGEAGEHVLTMLAGRSEVDTRTRARAALRERGVTLDRALDPRPDEAELRRLYARAFERADRAADDPRPMARITTNRGEIVIRLFADDAPGTVGNFLDLATAGFYDGILWHRVVPAFVAQAGCPRGDGSGGPGYTIRCEVNTRTYRRGSVGMALAGKDTGGSQFFICHRAVPHLDLRYTNFGEVVVGMDVVDALVPGDVIRSIRPVMRD